MIWGGFTTPIFGSTPTSTKVKQDSPSTQVPNISEICYQSSFSHWLSKVDLGQEVLISAVEIKQFNG